MRVPLGIAGGMLLSLSVASTAIAQDGPQATQSPDALAASGAPVLWLDGPFGRVPGGSLEDPMPGSDEPLLDAFVRDAPLGLLTDPPGVAVASWRVELHDGQDRRTLASGDGDGSSLDIIGFAGPSAAGTYLLSATVVTTQGSDLVGTWEIVVPDRAFPDDGLLDIPAPVLMLAADGDPITGVQGEGCYIFLCVIVGEPPPVHLIAALTPEAGSTLRLALSDGSGFSVEEALLVPIDGADDPIRLDARQTDDTTVELPDVPGGAWLLDVEIVFDRERGRSHWTFRLLPANRAA